MAILEVKNLKTQFKTDDGTFLAVDDVSFSVERGKTLGLVGESGCGKSVSSLSIMRLIPTPPGAIVGGQIFFEGTDLLKLSEKEMRNVRGNKISMIFQEPMTSLNPVFTIGDQIGEAVELHNRSLSQDKVRARAIEMLELVGIPEPNKRVDDYPHQLSGGMRQRVMIAMALSCDPSVLIADEPTTALDVTIQAQILDLIRKLQKDMGTAVILITHDLGVVAEMCDDVAVMYAGKIVEYANVNEVFKAPRHHYTQGLINSIPHFESGKKQTRLTTIPGLVPNLLELKPGCRFRDRCTAAQPDCAQTEPILKEVSGAHLVRCYHPVGLNKGMEARP